MFGEEVIFFLLIEKKPWERGIFTIITLAIIVSKIRQWGTLNKHKMLVKTMERYTFSYKSTKL